MQTITFECETITPMFMAGADGVTPELRAPSIKGALRFWWRAMNGHLSETILRKREGAIFGDTSHRSCFTIHLINKKGINIRQSTPVPHKSYALSAISANNVFEVKFMLTPIHTNEIEFGLNHLQSLFELVAILGGFGKRVRRGMGGFHVTAITTNGLLVPYDKKEDLTSIFILIKHHSKYYQQSDSAILLNYNGQMQPYPWINKIQIGNPDQDITRKISDTTHRLKNRYGQQYEPNLGHAFNGRFASPIYVSVLSDGETPIITSLNTVPERGKRDLDASIQDEFKNNILR